MCLCRAFWSTSGVCSWESLLSVSQVSLSFVWQPGQGLSCLLWEEFAFVYSLWKGCMCTSQSLKVCVCKLKIHGAIITVKDNSSLLQIGLYFITFCLNFCKYQRNVKKIVFACKNYCRDWWWSSFCKKVYKYCIIPKILICNCSSNWNSRFTRQIRSDGLSKAGPCVIVIGKRQNKYW